MRGRRRGVRVGAAVVTVLVAAVALPAVARALGTPATYAYVGHEALAPGIDHYLLRQGDPVQEVHVAEIHRSQVSRLRVVPAWDHVGGVPTETTSSMCLRLRCVLAVNADFTDLLSGGPVGTTVSAGELLRTPRQRHGNLSIGRAGEVRIGHDLPWRGTVEATGVAPLGLWGVNVQRPSRGPVMYTTRWGSTTRTPDGGVEVIARLAGGPTGPTTPIVVGELRRAGNSPILPGTVVLSAQDEGAVELQRWWEQVRRAGGHATLRVEVGDVAEAVGGSPVLVKDRHWAFPDNADIFTRVRQPRTAVGWTATGDLLLVTVDGRQPGYSAGMSLHELANLMIGLGAVEALNLDGGGSTTFVVHGQVRNRPSDGAQRRVSSALVLLPPPGTVATAAPRNFGSACPSERTGAHRFRDVSAQNPHGPAVACTAWWGVTGGSGGGDYRPAGNVTRGQLASFLARLVNRTGGALPVSPPDRFVDDSHSPHRRAIDKVAAVGIMAGAPDGRFRPDVPVTREQLSTALARTVEHRTGRTLPASPDYFTDDSGTHQPSINKVASEGLVGGAALHRYGPAQLVRRDQVATVLARTLDMLVEEDGVATPAG